MSAALTQPGRDPVKGCERERVIGAAQMQPGCDPVKGPQPYFRDPLRLRPLVVTWSSLHGPLKFIGLGA